MATADKYTGSLHGVPSKVQLVSTALTSTKIRGLSHTRWKAATLST
jgi:hypothetical protein